MIKKFLFVPLMWIISFGAFASADTVDWFTSDTQIYKYSISQQIDTVDMIQDFPSDMSRDNLYLCSDSSSVPYTLYLDSLDPYVFVSNSKVYCTSVIQNLFNGWDEIGIYSTYDWYWSPYNVPQNWILYMSNSPITLVDSESPETPDNWWSYVPWIPDSFTSWLTNLLNNFWSTIVGWLPTIILVSLWIYAIFALFRVIRGYARSSFNG